MLSNVDSLEYYKIGNNIYTSKAIAYTKSLHTTEKLQYVYNDEIFKKYDWTVEPEPNVPIGEFYRRRAQQLRDRYDYIVLQYSGGPDSQNILDTFLNYNIKLDEVVNFNSYAKTQIVQGTVHNADYVYNVKPFLESVLKKYSNPFKISIIDEIDMTKKVWQDFSDKDYFELLFTSSTFPSVWMFRGLWVKHVPHIWNKILEGKKVCILLGMDKTPLRIDSNNNKYHVNFLDLRSDVSFLISEHLEMKNSVNWEPFYHTPHMPDITIKQGHLLKNAVEKLTDINYFEPRNKYEGTDTRHAFGCRSKRFLNMNLKYEHYHKIVYPWWNPNIVTPKPAFQGNRVWDCWWVDQLETTEKKVWTNGMNKYIDTFDSVLNKKNNQVSTLPMVFTRPYYLEK